MRHSVLEHTIQLLSRLPGLGPRSARRIALHLLKYRHTVLPALSETMSQLAQHVYSCSICGNLDEVNPCHICTDPKRDASLLCIVEDIADVWALERGRIFSGKYHILGGSLSAIEGRGPDDLNIQSLLQRLTQEPIKEVILATNPTVDGQTTAHYLTELLQSYPVKISQLAYGLPIGSELDYLDEGTLTAALKSRQHIHETSES